MVERNDVYEDDHIRQATEWLNEDIDSDEYSTPGFKTALADTLMRIMIAHQLKRIADLLEEAAAT